MSKAIRFLGAVGAVMIATPAMATLFEAPDFPNFPPGPGEVIPPGCYLLAVGFIEPQDVDWVQAIMPMDADQVIVDVDTFDVGDLPDSIMEVWINGVPFGQNDDDSDDPLIDFCGHMDQFFDSAMDLGALRAGDVIDIGVTAFPDFSFIGDHTNFFEYEVWTWYVPTPSTAALLVLGGLLTARRR